MDMSTNFYWIYEEPGAAEVRLPTGEWIVTDMPVVDEYAAHIGKRYGFRHDNPDIDGPNVAFIFAVDPMVVLSTIKHKVKHRPGEKIVRDEYGREFTAKEFSILLYDCIKWELHSIGERFC